MKDAKKASEAISSPFSMISRRVCNTVRGLWQDEWYLVLLRNLRQYSQLQRRTGEDKTK